MIYGNASLSKSYLAQGRAKIRRITFSTTHDTNDQHNDNTNNNNDNNNNDNGRRYV